MNSRIRAEFVEPYSVADSNPSNQLVSMKRGGPSGENSKRVDSSNPNQEDSSHVILEDPFIDQYEEEEIVDGNEEDEGMAEEELQNEEQEDKAHDVCIK